MRAIRSRGRGVQTNAASSAERINAASSAERRLTLPWSKCAAKCSFSTPESSLYHAVPERQHRPLVRGWRGGAEDEGCRLMLQSKAAHVVRPQPRHDLHDSVCLRCSTTPWILNGSFSTPESFYQAVPERQRRRLVRGGRTNAASSAEKRGQGKRVAGVQSGRKSNRLGLSTESKGGCKEVAR